MNLGFFKKRAKIKNVFPTTAAIIAAAGSGNRMQGACKDKLFFEIEGLPVIAKTLLAYEEAETVSSIVVVARRNLIGDIFALARELEIKKLSAVVPGGKTRAESVLAGIEALKSDTEFVCIADGARPFISPSSIDEVNLAAYKSGAAAACTEVTDTIKKLDASAKICETVDRSRLVAMQTPQTFLLADYKTAVSRLGAAIEKATDDCAVFEAFGKTVTPVFTDKMNIKITSPDDLVIANAIASLKNEPEKSLR